jgi:type I restriction enzyme, S subunit
VKEIHDIPKGWKYLILKKLITQDIKNGYSPNCPEEPNGRWILSLGNLTENGLDPSQVKPAPKGDMRVQDFLLEPGDFLISRSNTLDKVGRTMLFRGEIENCSYPDLLMRFRVDETQVTNEYLEGYLRGSIVRTYIQRCASGTSGSMVKINKTVVEKIPVVLPTIPEQKAIADLLSTWDEAIEKTERLIQAKEKQFKSLMRELLSEPRNTQKGAKWESVKLDQVCKIASKEKLSSVDGHFLLTVKLHCLGIERNDRIAPILTERGRPYYQHKTGDFLIGRQNFHNGGFGIIPPELDGGITSNAISCLIVSKSKLSKDFLWFQFANPNYYKKVGHVMDGTGQKELSDKQILKLIICLPDLETQHQIVEILSSAQHEIVLLKQLAERYKTQKRGLMQKMLTGEWRVKPEIVNQYMEA